MYLKHPKRQQALGWTVYSTWAAGKRGMKDLFIRYFEDMLGLSRAGVIAMFRRHPCKGQTCLACEFSMCSKVEQQ